MRSRAPAGSIFAPSTSPKSRRFQRWYGRCERNSGRSTGSSTMRRSAPAGSLPRMRDDDIERLVRVNTLSPLILTKHVVRSMLAAGTGGRIITIASVAAFTGFKGLAAYSATKASLVGLTRSLAREIGAAAITVNAVAPGFMETDMTRSLTDAQRARTCPAQSSRTSRRRRRRSSRGRIPSRRESQDDHRHGDDDRWRQLRLKFRAGPRPQERARTVRDRTARTPCARGR